jgi:hypothetical protein
MVESLIKAASKDLSPELASKLIASLERVDSQFGTADTQWRPVALKVT